MNWQSVSFDWNQVRAFLATVEEGSLSAAARALNLTQPTLGRQVAALEEHLGVLLFDRVGRSLVLTPAGTELLDHVRAMRDAASRIALSATGRSQAIEGHVVITASGGFSTYLLPEMLKELRACAPGITIELIVSDTVRDLLRREADIAIRHARPEQPDLIARLVGESTGHLYASPAYLDRHGRPDTPQAASALDFIGYDTSNRLIEYLNGLGMSLTPRNFPLISDSGVAGWQMVQQGLGVGVMVKDVADRTPGIEQVLPTLPPIPVPVWLTTHRELHTNRRIRLVYDFLAEAIARL